MNKVSVILPVYNTSKYLKKCFESILNQTYTSFELICVNDGSTDNSLQILEEYAQKDDRIKIITQKNQGLGNARNAGIIQTSGDYICYIDSDDYIHQDLLKDAVNKILEDDSDVVIYDNYNVYRDSTIPVYRVKNFINKHKTDCFHYEEFKQIAYQSCVAWNKLYKKQIIVDNNLKFFEDVKMGEDSPFWFDLLSLNPKISLLDKCLYYYIKREDSLTKRSEDYIDRQIELYKKYKDTLKDNISVDFRLTILDYNVRCAINGYCANNSLKIFLIYEKSLRFFAEEYKNFKGLNLWKYEGYFIFRFRWFYYIGKNLVLYILKLKNRWRCANG